MKRQGIKQVIVSSQRKEPTVDKHRWVAPLGGTVRKVSALLL